MFPADFADYRRFELKVYKVCKVLVVSILNSVSVQRFSAKSAGNIILY